MRSGRPLRFLAMTLGGWTAVRLAILWPQIDSVPAVIRAIAPPVAAAVLPGAPDDPGGPRLIVPLADPVTRRPLPAAAMALRRLSPTLALAGMVRFGPAEVVEDQRSEAAAAIPATPPPLVPTPRPEPPGRLAGSAWLIARGGSNGTLLGGQLGGSQAGARLTYALGESRRVALAARIATPLAGRGAEAAVGVEWQPSTLPIRLVAEQRFTLDGGKGGPTGMVIGGIGPTRVVRGLNVEAYGQAGAIARRGGEAFGDGAARLTTPISLPGRLRLDLGAGGWGAAQRGARRLDVGPTAGLVVPGAGKALRLTADWRQRIAGDARPGSGPALSLGTDF